MKNLTIAANWKSNITKIEARKWLEEFALVKHPENEKVVLLAPFTLLDMISGYIRINDLGIILGAQDVSPFDSGPYTEELSAKQIKEFADIVLIGHSERRANFSESNEMVNQKIAKARNLGLEVIVCVSELEQVKALNSTDLMIAYEPLSAIGSGNPQNPEEVFKFVSQIKDIKNVNVIYGGSVNTENVKLYTEIDNIDGVLVGSESLNAKSFSNLLINAI